MPEFSVPVCGASPAPPDVAGSGVVIPSPAEPPLGLVLTCGSNVCRHAFEPHPLAFAGGSLACPRCGDWTFRAELVEPATTGGEL